MEAIEASALNAEILNSSHAHQASFSFSTNSLKGIGYGFGGAKITEMKQLMETSHASDIVFFGVDNELNRHLGVHNPGAASFVRKKTFCMMPWTQSRATPCHDIGIVTAEDPENTLQAVRFISKYLASIGMRPALIGCDHTASIGGVIGVTDAIKKPITYLYLDAHFDLGLHNITPDLHNGNFMSTLLKTKRVERVVNLGGRCSSNYVPVYKNVPGFICMPCEVEKTAPKEIIEHLSWFRGSSVYVSIDADVLDPSCAPNVSCPEPFGMTAFELFSICEWIGKSCDVIGADLCEIVPSNHSLESERVLMRCLHALFPKRAARP